MKNKKIVSIVIGIVVLAGVFYGGMFYGKNKTPALGTDRFGSNMQNRIGQFNADGGNNKMGSGGLIAGEIISKDNKSVTVKLTDGGSKIIFLDTSTAVTKMATGSANELIIGTQVSVTGTSNSDGSIMAKSIQIRPQIKQNTETQ